MGVLAVPIGMSVQVINAHDSSGEALDTWSTRHLASLRQLRANLSVPRLVYWVFQ